MKDKSIPETDSIQELARFWDTHDLMDYEDELEEVDEPVFQRGKLMKIRLESEEAEAVESIAKSRGVSDSELIHEWVREKIHVG
jgi:hypothetical protein